MRSRRYNINKIEELVAATWRNAVFETFPVYDQQKLALVGRQIAALAAGLSADLDACLIATMPELNASDRQRICNEIVPKTAAFGPALAMGEIDDMPKLLAFAVAVSRMYLADQSMDRRDPHMPEAILSVVGESRNRDTLLGSSSTGFDASDPGGSDRHGKSEKSHKPSTTVHSSTAVRLRADALRDIEREVAELAKPEDAPFVLPCFYDQVLYHEVVMHQLSIAYEQLADELERQQFLEKHAERIAEVTTISAGFPSISSTLYALYRWQDPTLPSLPETYSNQAMLDLMQVCNAIARLWDEYGDREMDRGNHPMGSFVINPFNQYHPAMVRRFGELAFMHKEQITRLQDAIARFYEDEARYGKIILEILLEHVRAYVGHLSPAVTGPYGRYVECCRRVLEIAYVNTVGDPALAGPNNSG